MIGKKLLSTPAMIAEAMNVFYVEKFAKLKENESPEDNPLAELRTFLADKPTTCFTLKELTKDDTAKLA